MDDNFSKKVVRLVRMRKVIGLILIPLTLPFFSLWLVGDIVLDAIRAIAQRIKYKEHKIEKGEM